MSKIISIGTALPNYQSNQLEILAFMRGSMVGTEDDHRKLNHIYARSGIETRYSVIPDYNLKNKKRELYSEDKYLEPFPTLEKRMALYHQFAARLAYDAIHSACSKISYNIKSITHLITVSCTGLSAPGIDLELISLLDLPSNTQRTSVNFMGCYAAVHALKQADAICTSNPKAQVLVVCVELCTLHFQKNNDYDNWVANALFSDGAAACIVTHESSHEDHTGISIKDFYSEVYDSGKKDMAWQVSSSGFLMTLSAYVPELIESNIDQLMNNALKKYGITKNDVTYWAMHPGGRKILDVIQQKLNLNAEDLFHSYQVLKNYGNMSSPTILFVLQSLSENNNPAGDMVGAAFGPGLTMETFYFQLN